MKMPCHFSKPPARVSPNRCASLPAVGHGNLPLLRANVVASARVGPRGAAIRQPTPRDACDLRVRARLFWRLTLHLRVQCHKQALATLAFRAQFGAFAVEIVLLFRECGFAHASGSRVGFDLDQGLFDTSVSASVRAAEK